MNGITCTGDPNEEAIVRFRVEVVARIGREDYYDRDLTGTHVANLFAGAGAEFLDGILDVNLATSVEIIEEP